MIHTGRMRRAMSWKRATGVWRIVVALVALFVLVGACRSEDNATRSQLDDIRQRGVLRAGIRFDNPPHSFIDAEGRWVGFDIDIADALARELGVGLERVRVDELTRISFLKEKKIDVAVASMSHTIKRDREIDFSQTYFWTKQTFLVRRGQVESLAALVGKKVGMSRGSHAIGNWRTWLARNGYQGDPDIVEFSDKRAGMEAVRQGAIAGYAEDLTILSSFAKQDASLAVLAHEGIGMKQDGIGIRENDSKLRDEINFALQRMAVSGEYELIYDSWFGPDSNTPIPRESSIDVWPDG
jgi:polar amino acid transport system substrate-binding protein